MISGNKAQICKFSELTEVSKEFWYQRNSYTQISWWDNNVTKCIIPFILSISPPILWYYAAFGYVGVWWLSNSSGHLWYCHKLLDISYVVSSVLFSLNSILFNLSCFLTCIYFSDFSFTLSFLTDLASQCFCFCNCSHSYGIYSNLSLGFFCPSIWLHFSGLSSVIWTEN